MDKKLQQKMHKCKKLAKINIRANLSTLTNLSQFEKQTDTRRTFRLYLVPPLYYFYFIHLPILTKALD